MSPDACLLNEHIPLRWTRSVPRKAFKKNAEPTSSGVVFPLRFFTLPQCVALSPNKGFRPGTEQTAHLGENKMEAGCQLGSTCARGPLANRVRCPLGTWQGHRSPFKEPGVKVQPKDWRTHTSCQIIRLLFVLCIYDSYGDYKCWLFYAVFFHRSHWLEPQLWVLFNSNAGFGYVRKKSFLGIQFTLIVHKWALTWRLFL